MPGCVYKWILIMACLMTSQLRLQEKFGKEGLHSTLVDFKISRREYGRTRDTRDEASH